MSRIAWLIVLTSCGRLGFGDGARASDGPVDAPTYLGTVLSDLPASYWRFDETSGTYSTDQTGAAPGTYSSATLGQAGATSDADLALGLSHATGGSMKPGDFYEFAGNSKFTLEVWARPTAFSMTDSNVLLSKANTTDGYQFYFDFGVPTFERSLGGVQNTAMSTVLPLATWSHLVATYDGSLLSIYVNGQIKAAAPSSMSINSTPGLTFAVGAFPPGGGGFDGTLDEAAVYDHVLADARILAHCQAANNPDVVCGQP